ncbi:MAG TPA: DUF542 domain-containing protein, partial [Holophagaceae bacterium]
MTPDLQTKLGDLVLARPETMRYFEGLGLDYCCGGHRSLGEACAAAGLEPGTVLSALESLAPAAEDTPDLQGWTTAQLETLIDHLVATHHEYLRTELPRLRGLLVKVMGAHGERHPELDRVSEIFMALEADLMPHLLKEEQILFPFIVRMEHGETGGACFGSVQSPIRVMEMEHEAVGSLLAELRALTNAYTAPADGCATFRALY